MQYIIDAPPRTGKSQYMIYLIDKFTKQYPNRHIVTNIIGINYPGVISINSTLHKPVDWRDYPNGTIFIFDEAHEHPAFSADDLMKDMHVDTRDLDSIMMKISNGIFDENVLYYIDNYFSFNQIDEEQIEQIKNTIKNQKRLPIDFKKQLFEDINKKKKMAVVKRKEEILDIGRSLTLHGHFGFDIYLITQDIKRLNAATIAATSKHLKLRRLFGWPMMFIYEYSDVQKYFAASTRNNAISIRLFFYRPYLYKYYISSEDHNVQKSFPFMILMLLMIIPLLGYWGYSKLKSANALGVFDEKSAQEASSQEQNKQAADGSATAASEEQKTVDCNVYDNLHLPECQVIQKEKNAQLQAEVRQSIGYNPNSPYNDLSLSMNYQASAQPVFSGCVKYDGKYYAYSQQGTRLNVSSEDCKRLIEDGDRPFNYFAKERSFTAEATTAALTSSL
ncbi:zonular occludens toxin domain-containing protein [Acinetobacter haemolyticus]|uniref:zonular occludens toxin domain-containing protein n=1 Tax=Acinetobacter haemolyticus TaxID=29430 RepID=UPI000E1699B4|nr:zonular occludens toxin domain-containing protein [Acinetobacter haemolyticus]SUU20039.1 putative phage-like protein [Acinetobacter haemolyticus]